MIIINRNKIVILNKTIQAENPNLKKSHQIQLYEEFKKKKFGNPIWFNSLHFLLLDNNQVNLFKHIIN